MGYRCTINSAFECDGCEDCHTEQEIPEDSEYYGMTSQEIEEAGLEMKFLADLL